ncbi:LysM peptidoglycan-binding domain-containing protein [Megasphaera sp.]|uniref:LysM peptidoglycan-binding domain-containing protein n=1 Tax=Megasphaera sp. TaxID=2023260 RepID=UPI0025BD38BD|nr:LysM peptidoglycan-binding domain-containing protein [Megasphaera sp.]MCF0151924.1 LysM peptidoglycan-binding domain-containing protein [Megasphaera sp.]
MKYVILAVLALFMCTQIGWSYQPSQEYVSVAVESGQTVWQLASVVADEDTDVRQVMDSILKENGLTGTSDIRPGQVLRLPVAPGRAEQVRTALARQLVD